MKYLSNNQIIAYGIHIQSNSYQEHIVFSNWYALIDNFLLPMGNNLLSFSFEKKNNNENYI